MLLLLKIHSTGSCCLAKMYYFIVDNKLCSPISPSFVNVEENASVRIFFFSSFFTFTRKKKASTNDLCTSLVSIKLTNIRYHVDAINTSNIWSNPIDFSRYSLTYFTRDLKKKKKKKFDHHESSLILCPRSPNNPLSKVRTEWWCESSKAPWFLLYIYIIYVYNIYV